MKNQLLYYLFSMQKKKWLVFTCVCISFTGLVVSYQRETKMPTYKLTKYGDSCVHATPTLHPFKLQEKGYTPEGLINFVAALGWSPKTEKEIFSLQELIESFSLDGINK